MNEKTRKVFESLSPSRKVWVKGNAENSAVAREPLAKKREVKGENDDADDHERGSV